MLPEVATIPPKDTHVQILRHPYIQKHTQKVHRLCVISNAKKREITWNTNQWMTWITFPQPKYSIILWN